MKKPVFFVLLLAAAAAAMSAGTFTSDDYFYSLQFPSDWEVSDEDDPSQVILSNSDEDAAVVIGVFAVEPGLTSEALLQAVVDKMRLKGRQQAYAYKGFNAIVGNYQFTMNGMRMIADLVVFNTKTCYFMIMGSSLKDSYTANSKAFKVVFESFTLDGKALDAALQGEEEPEERPVTDKKTTTDKKAGSEETDKSKMYALKINWGDLENTFAFIKPDYYTAVKEGREIIASGDLWAYYGVDPANDPSYTQTFWARYFQDMYDKNYVRVAGMVEWFKAKSKEKGWSSWELAVQVVKCVQAIPYERPYQVITDQTQAAAVLDYFTPNEIAWYNKGDCDTKSLLIIMILRQLGYDMVMYFSEYYQHAMCGINLNAKGVFKTHGGKKYYFIEATYPGWNIGDLPQDFGDPDKWTLVIIE